MPDLLRIEVLSVLRRQLRIGAIGTDRAEWAVDDLLDLPVEVYPAALTLRRSWELRENVTAYDACYIALAEFLGCPLVTVDAKLSKAPGTRCVIELL